MKRKYIISIITVFLLVAVMIVILKFTRKQFNGIADGKYRVVDCPEYPDAYIQVKDNSIQIYNLDINSIYRLEQIEEISKMRENEEIGIFLSDEEIEELSDLNRMFVENSYEVDINKGYKNGTYSYVYKCQCKGNYFGLIFIYDSYEKTIKINNYQKKIVFKK